MVYAIVGLAVACFGMIIWMAVWVSRLKDAINASKEECRKYKTLHADAILNRNQQAARADALRGQLRALRKEYEDAIQALENGGGDVGSIADRLRRGMPKVS